VGFCDFLRLLRARRRQKALDRLASRPECAKQTRYFGHGCVQVFADTAQSVRRERDARRFRPLASPRRVSYWLDCSDRTAPVLCVQSADVRLEKVSGIWQVKSYS